MVTKREKDMIFTIVKGVLYFPVGLTALIVLTALGLILYPIAVIYWLCSDYSIDEIPLMLWLERQWEKWVKI